LQTPRGTGPAPGGPISFRGTPHPPRRSNLTMETLGNILLVCTVAVLISMVVTGLRHPVRGCHGRHPPAQG